MIAERRFMFELLAFIKRSGVSGNKEVEDCIAKCSQHYGNILEQEEGRQQALLENLKSLTDKCLTGIGNMQAKIEKLFNQQSVELTAQKEVINDSPAWFASRFSLTPSTDTTDSYYRKPRRRICTRRRWTPV